MSLSLVLLLVAFAAFAAALWVQGTGIGEDEARFRRRRRRVGLSLGGLLLGLGAVQAVHSTGAMRRLLAPPEDGAWNAVSLDGRAVAAGEFRIGITDGQVSGGRDGCNEWGFDGEDERTGERRIVSTLVGCDESDPARRAYRAVAFAREARPFVGPDGTMRIAARGHEGLFRRCRWSKVKPPPGASGSPGRTCVTG
jgi:hypothetical protein